jgi:hypothetical protein
MKKQTKKPSKKQSFSLTVGTAVVVRGIPFHYIGRIAEVQARGIVLEDAGWLADSARWSDFLKNGTINEYEPYPDPVWISWDVIADVTPWRHALPLAQK